MSAKKHTPEPWLASGPTTEISIVSKKGKWMIAQLAYGLPNNATLANAARIVACVNAMAGIEDPEQWVAMAKSHINASNEQADQNQRLKQRIAKLEATLLKIRDSGALNPIGQLYAAINEALNQ